MEDGRLRQVVSPGKRIRVESSSATSLAYPAIHVGRADVKRTLATPVADQNRRYAVMTSVANLPRAFVQQLLIRLPMMTRLSAISIMSTSGGWASSPLMTAVQKRAAIGLMGKKSILIPTSVASTITE
jgi:hypothetical protein